VRIRVYQGESRRAEENELLGEFEFSGFKNARRGEVRIEVTFEIDTDGIVKVTARDPDTAQVASTQIHLSSGLSEEEIRDLIDKHQAPEAPSAAPEQGMSGATLATVASVAANPPALEGDLADPFDALAVGAGEVEFDADELEAAAEVPLEGPADSDFELDPAALEIGEPLERSGGDEGYETEIQLEGARAVDALDALDEADLDSLAALPDDEAAATAEELAPEAITQRRAAPADDLFGSPDSDLSIFGDDDDDEV
jgi:hypothetical protein